MIYTIKGPISKKTTYRALEMRLNELEQLEKQKRWQRAANLYTQDKLMILVQAPLIPSTSPS
jgi:hypothetical protein